MFFFFFLNKKQWIFINDGKQLQGEQVVLKNNTKTQKASFKNKNGADSIYTKKKPTIHGNLHNRDKPNPEEPKTPISYKNSRRMPRIIHIVIRHRITSVHL